MRIRVFLLAVFLALVALVASFAALPRVAVGDFTVTSDDPSLKYVGKGLAEMLAAELFQSKGVMLIDRDRRAELLGEAEFSVVGLRRHHPRPGGLGVGGAWRQAGGGGGSRTATPT